MGVAYLIALAHGDARKARISAMIFAAVIFILLKKAIN